MAPHHTRPGQILLDGLGTAAQHVGHKFAVVHVEDLDVVVLRLHVIERIGTDGEFQRAVIVVEVYQRGVCHRRRLPAERHLVLQHLQLLGLGPVCRVERLYCIRYGHDHQHAPHGLEQDHPYGLLEGGDEDRRKERVKERYGDDLGQQPRNIFGECEPHAVLHTIEQAFACRHYQQRPGIEYSRQEQMPHVGETEPDGIRERRVYGHEHERESKHEYHRPEQILFVE